MTMAVHGQGSWLESVLVHSTFIQRQSDKRPPLEVANERRGLQRFEQSSYSRALSHEHFGGKCAFCVQPIATSLLSCPFNTLANLRNIEIGVQVVNELCHLI
jgi:hypothetical protein